MIKYTPEELESRIVAEAEFIVHSDCTVRYASKHFQVGKTQVHRDVTTILGKMAEVNPSYKDLHNKVTAVIAKNKAERHLRGGEATKRVYANKRKKH